MSFNIDTLQKKIDIQFENIDLLEQALTHRSIGHQNNERLEFLGDAVLGFVIAGEIYSQYPTADEGVLSRMRASLVNQDALATIAKSLGLSDELILGAGERKSGGKNRASILSDALEAIVGAIYIDQGVERAQHWVLQVFKEPITNVSIQKAKLKDPKSRLQEYLQGKNEDVPIYTVLSTTGHDHNQLFTVQCQINMLNEAFVAKASTRKKAEQKAALKALEQLDE